MPPRKPRIEHVIICDDVRQEVGNKLSFIGVYPPTPDIFVPKLPLSLPKLCFVLSCKNLKEGDLFSIQLVDPTNKKLADIEERVVLQKVRKRGVVTIFAMFAPLNVEAEGLHKVVVTFNKDDKTKYETGFKIKGK